MQRSVSTQKPSTWHAPEGGIMCNPPPGNHIIKVGGAHIKICNSHSGGLNRLYYFSNLGGSKLTENKSFLVSQNKVGCAAVVGPFVFNGHPRKNPI